MNRENLYRLTKTSEARNSIVKEEENYAQRADHLHHELTQALRHG